jgi:hypothetical protein
MKKLALGMLLVGLFTACGDDGGVHIIDSNRDAVSQCDPLKQTGCPVGQKCSWFIDALDPPQYIGHLGCTPDGTANIGDACMFGAPGETGVDNCKAGSVCSAYRGGANPGICKAICDQAGGNPQCDSSHVCVTYSDLFATGETTPASAGVCDVACDPMTDNDYDGSGSDGTGGILSGPASAKRSMTCGSAANVGCYGGPSGGTPPATGFSCTNEVHYALGSANGGLGLRHRTQCLTTNGCAAAGPKIYLNSCNQGYVPLIVESTEVSTRICMSICKPANCFSGSCGAGNVNRAGEMNDGCRLGDRVNASSTGPMWDDGNSDGGGEHCQFMWINEISDDNMFLPSKNSNTTGFCYNHAAYKFNKDSDATTGVGGREAPLPDCATLADGFGSGSSPSAPDYYGAAELGCVDTMHAGLGSALAQGKAVVVPEAILRKRAQLDLPRPLYRREMDQR